MKNRKSPFLFAIIFVLLLPSCKSDDEKADLSTFTCANDNPTAKNNRVVGIDLLNLTKSNSFEDNLALASELGVEFIALHVLWASLEPSAHTFTDPGNALELLSQTAVASNLKFSLTIRPIDLVGKTVPSDLNTVRFNDPEMIARFKSLIDFVFTKVDPSVLLNLQIGNEIDGYDTSSEHPDFWLDYGVFLNETTSYIHTTNPEVKVGFTGTLHGLLAQPSVFNILAENVDILGVTYYPIESSFDVQNPSAVFGDFDNLVTTYGNTPIYLQEVGYQTSTQNNSTEAKQAEFYCNFFQSWDQHANNIKSANIVRLNDISLEGATASASPYGISSDSFIEYLRTLGLRTYDDKGGNKQAFDVVKSSLEARGW